MRLFVLLFFITVVFSFGYSQSVDNYFFESISIEQGLTQNTVTGIVQDNDGFIWIATEDGLNRYDGVEIVQFRNSIDDSVSLPVNYVFKTHCDINNRLWLRFEKDNRCNYGVYQKSVGFMQAKDYLNRQELNESKISQVFCDSRGRLWIVFYKSDNRGRLMLLHQGRAVVYNDYNFIGAVFEDAQQQIWICTENGLVKISDDNTQVYYSSNAFVGPREIIEDKDGRIWIACANGLFYLQKGKFVVFQYGKIKSPHRLLVDNDGVIWGGMGNDAVFYIKNETLEIYTVKRTKYKSTPLVTGIVEDNSGNIWMGTRGEGIIIYNKTLEKFIRLTQKNTQNETLLSDDIVCLFKDKAQRIWIGTYEKGVLVHDPRKQIIKKLTSAGGELNQLDDLIVRTIQEDMHEKLWLGTRESGLVKVDPLSLRCEQHLSKYDVESLLIENDTMFYIGTRFNGILVYNPTTRKGRKVKIRTDGLSVPGNNYIRKIIKDKDRNIWFGRWGGLIKYDSKLNCFANITFSSQADSSKLRYVFDIFQDSNGRLWFGSEAGLSEIDTNGNLLKLYKNVPGDSASISNNTVFHIFEDRKGILWVGTFGGGLNQFNPDSGVFTNYRTSDGLPNDCIYTIASDDHSNLWMSTNFGLSCFNPEKKSFKNFFKEDGLSVNAFNFGAFCKTKNGLFYYGPETGVNFFKPEKMPVFDSPAKVVINGFRVYDSDKDFYYFEQNKAAIVLEPHEKVFSFSFVSPEYTKPGKIKYYYKINELHNHWIACDNSRSALFSNLPHGQYTFMVKAAYDKWEESDVTAVPFHIKPPFYRTYWFYALVSVLILGILYALYLSKIRHLKKIEKIRAGIAQDLHDEIGSNLGSIGIMSNLISNEDIDENKRKDFADKISYLAKKTGDSMRDVIWFIDPANDTAAMLLLRMKEFVNRILVNHEVIFNADKSSLSNNLPSNVKRNIYLAFKEAVNNIVRHASATKVKIELQRKENLIIFTVQDNGVGFEPKKSGTGMGLNGLKKRTMQINGKLEIHSELKKGTRIQIEVPV